MDVSSVSNASFSRSVTPSKSSSDRQYSAQTQANIVENKDQERAVQERIQQHKEESQRRLDGRLISFGQEQDDVSSQQKQASFNRSRVNEAYSPPRQNEITYSQNEQAERARDRERNQNNEAIDIVV